MTESLTAPAVNPSATTPAAGKHRAIPHLHVHSDFSLSKGASKVPDIIKRAVELGVPAVALVEEGNMYGAYDFSQKAPEYGLQPIVGTKLWLPLDDKLKGSIILLAQNAKGYENICTILAASHRPHGGSGGGEALIDRDLFLAEGSDGSEIEGVIALTGGMDGWLHTLVRHGRYDMARAQLDWLRHWFGDRLFVEVSRTGDESAEEVLVEEGVIDLAYDAPEMTCADGVVRRGVPLVGTSEVWYATPDRNDAFEFLKVVSAKAGQVKLDDVGKVIAPSPRRYYMRSPEEMAAMFTDIPEALDNAEQIARRCSFLVDKRKPILPPFKTEGGRSENEELSVQSWTGLEKRLKQMQVPEDEHQVYKDRLQFELDIIIKMEFPGYFLIVSDFIKWSKANGIPVGPGRGSGAGSLVAYALEITNIDPLPHGLLFERFLNPERVSMPDFDVDFCQDRREEVIRYVYDRYGGDLVSLIATFGVIKSKTAIKDVGRYAASDDFGSFGFGELDRLNKLVPMEGAEPKKLKDALADKENPLFREMVDSDAKYGILIENAKKVEGLYRSAGSHAAGVIIGDRPLYKLAPMGWDQDKQMLVAQYNMKGAESVGFVKFDFLGLKTLDVLLEAVTQVKRTTGVTIDLDTLPLDDAATYEMLAEGMTNGIFQFESDGMKKWLQQLKPDRFGDLVAMTSLYRPGPMDMIPNYVDRKNGRESFSYPEPATETKPFLEETHGIMVYQEQVMLVAQKVAGYTLGQADMLRRAMGKKIHEEMVRERARFVENAAKLGRDPDAVSDLFDLIMKFAGYGFNKSHAAAYSMISYHTAYLKKHYPAQFIAAVMTYEMGSTDGPRRMAKLKEDMDLWGVPMLPPDISRSFPRFTPEEYQPGKFGVRFGLGAIKGVSGDMDVMLKAREKGGEFKSLEDFYKRAGTQFNKGQYQALCEAGAFDLISKNRASAFKVLSFLSKGGKKTDAAQTDLFGGTLDIAVPSEVADEPEWGNKDDRAYQAVGFYFGEHPMERYESKLRKLKVKRRASLVQWMKDNGRAELVDRRMAGLVEDCFQGTTKKGNPYVKGVFAEKADVFDVSFYGDPHHLQGVFRILEDAKKGRRPVVISVKIALEDRGSRLYGNEAWDAEELMAGQRGRIRIVLDRDGIMLSSEESARVREAARKLAAGEIDKTAMARTEGLVRIDALKRKARDVSVAVARLRADDQSGSVPVLVTLKAGEAETNIALEGLYRIDQAAENSMKSIDGVVSVSEEV
jgi:DNA polymerase-3 subunit alpha